MRRSQHKFVAWFVLTFMSLNPLLEVLAIDMAAVPSIAICQALPAASSDVTPSVGEKAPMDCVHHHACVSYCQFTPLQPADLKTMQVGQLPWLSIPDKPDDLVTRFLEEIERPPRV